MTWKVMTAQDLNSININPVFVSATDLHLTTANTGIDNKGTPLFYVPYDMDASPRSLTTPDMGADEFNSILPRLEDDEVRIATEPGMSVYPNPTANDAKIDINLGVKSDILVEIYNSVGERMSILAEGTYSEGVHHLQLNSSEFNNGTYLVRFVANNASQIVKRLIISK